MLSFNRLWSPNCASDSRDGFMRNLIQDIQYALRQLRKSPGFTAVAVISLALGIGANVVVFGVLDALLLRPLDVPHPEQVYTLQHRAAQDLSMSYPDYRDVRERNTVFSSLAMYRVARIGLEAPDGAHPVWGYEASGNYFDMLGVKPVLGNFFHASDEGVPGASPFVVLSYNCWKDRFAGDPNVVNKVIRLNKHPYTVIAVAPRNFSGVERFYWPEVWVPITNVKEIEGYNWIQNRSDQNAWVAGRLKPGVTPKEAEANLNGIASQLAREYPGTDEHLSFRLTKPGFLGDSLGGPLRGFMFGLMLLAALVLLASCANLGGLFAARASDRSRELAIRMAIGSSRTRIFRQLLTEATVVSLAGGALALALGNVLLSALTQWHPPTDLPIQLLVRSSWPVYFFAFAAALATGLIFGAVPARQIWNADPNLALRGGASTPILGRRWALRDALLGIQIALCCLLVTASFVSLRGLARTFQLPLGFNPDAVTLAAFDLQLANYNGAEAGIVQQRLLEHVPNSRE
jgi:predicted permease